MTAASGGTPAITNVILALIGFWAIAGFFLRRASGRAPGDGDERVDPGWRPALVRVFPLSRPRIGTTDAITAMRVVFLGLVIAAPLMLFALSFFTPWRAGSTGVVPYVVAAAGVAALIGIGFVRARPLDIADDTRLAGSFRAAMFIGIGLCEAPTLLGVAGSLLTDSLWILVLGLVPTMVGFALIAPGPHEIGRRQRQIVAAHSHLDLALALLRPLPPTGA